jgi:hypothetical protein
LLMQMMDFDYHLAIFFEYDVLVVRRMFHDALYVFVLDRNINLVHQHHLVKHFVVYDVFYLFIQ